jgi:hypothetical protein
MVLISSVGVCLDVHYCQGDVQAIGFYSDAPNCYDEMLMVSDLETNSNSLSSSCCKDEFIYGKVNIESKEDLKLNLDDLILASFTYVPVFRNFQTIYVQVQPEDDLSFKDVRVLYQQFLI